ncbi:immune inhibitor A [Pseudoalteromonas sp. MMG013]|uniref:GEVED domain-containing protein n=1 Tax=Pseudoalteromonas sp. MMG013 TaxID=2822687 RepID=UPI001B38AD7C|nr:GEVED domain-containing protein [Pseudoalteromonas sp. MMG013]MBQ4860077.1 immune inhibitor A [Pseudoalteromonas sp. MMG013]
MKKFNNGIPAISIISAIMAFSFPVQAETLLEAGKMKVPLILANFSDTKTTTTPSQIENKLFNSEHDVSAYFDEVSYGNFDVIGTAFDWVQLPQKHDFYGTNDADNNDWDTNYVQLGKDSIAASDALIDFSKFDANSDCIVDSVAVVYQGYAENDPGTDEGLPTDIWPINMALKNEPTKDRCTSDTTRFMTVERLTLIPELRSDNADGLTPIGLLTHELVHSGFGNRLGGSWFPDLYGSGNHKGISRWGLMGIGNHLSSIPYRTPDGQRNPNYVADNYSRPAHATAFTKVLMNWVEPIELSAGDSIKNAQIHAASTNNPTIYKLTNPKNPEEYYLIENRYQDADSFDAGIETSGLAVWHIDEGSWSTATKKGCSFPDNPIDAATKGTCDKFAHSVIALVQADNLWELQKGKGANQGDLYSNRIAGISTSTYPSTRFYDFSESGLAITNISASGPIMTADINVSFPNMDQPIFCADEKAYTRGPSEVTLNIKNTSTDKTVGFYWLNEEGKRYPDFALRAPYAWLTPDAAPYNATDFKSGDKIVLVDQSDNCLAVTTLGNAGTDVEIRSDGGYANNVKIFDLGDDLPKDYAVPAQNNTNWEHIDNISLANVAHSSGDDAGYGDYSALAPFEIAQGDSISMSASGKSKENWLVWVDLNNDFEFSNDELVYQSDVKSNDVSGTLSNLSAAVGITTRMRIAMSYRTPTAIGGFEGEIEDYTVTIIDNSAGCTPDCDTVTYAEPEKNNTHWEHIDSVKINMTTHLSGDDGGYGDYSHKPAITISQNDEISLSASGNKNERWIVWVDLNSDGQFSDDEVTYQSPNKSNDVSGTLENLTDAMGLTTRMRIAMSYRTPTATGGFEGEIEDYTVTIQ